ncbi:ABC transporter ATP-binding protein [Carnobacterium sp. FSL E2-0243]|uniref:ABC transporter ATP-binding protein n=1 Tax=Carnobacterium sp. FSL E2-0243 TaxID=2921365 RepID=UPI0030F6CC06
MKAIEFRQVTKHFIIKKKNKHQLFGKKQFNILKAVDQASFSIAQGEIVGIVGLNGSGKSTLTDLMAEVTRPSYGRITRKGTTSLLAINAGLKPNLSGIDNIKLKCLYHGLDMKNIQKILPKIIRFSELDNFIKQPIKTYSSGMKAKLGFSIAIHLNADILIVDEALSVGDQTFYKKCLSKILEKNSEGVTIIFVSHSLSQVRELCHKAIWINQGRIMRVGKAREVCDEFQHFICQINQLNAVEKEMFRKKSEKNRFTRSDLLLKKKATFKWYSRAYMFIILLLFITSIYLMLK